MFTLSKSLPYYHSIRNMVYKSLYNVPIKPRHIPTKSRYNTPNNLPYDNEPEMLCLFLFNSDKL
jgi:hypothetical protein